MAKTIVETDPVVGETPIQTLEAEIYPEGPSRDLTCAIGGCEQIIAVCKECRDVCYTCQDHNLSGKCISCAFSAFHF